MKNCFSFFMLFLCLFFFGQVTAQTNFFHPVKSVDKRAAQPLPVFQTIRRQSLVQLDEAAMRAYLLAAPMEFNNNGAVLPMEIPFPDGSVETFGFVESPVLSPEIAAQYPEIKSYSGNSIKNKQISIRISLTSNGFNAILLNGANQDVYIEKYDNNKQNLYSVYYTRDAVKPFQDMSPSCKGSDHGYINILPKLRTPAKTTNSTGATLRTFRFALAATGEFTEARPGADNTAKVAAAYADLVAYVNRMNAVYIRELCVKLLLVTSSNIVYPDKNTDPYTHSSSNTMLTENQTNLDNISVLGSANYDIGHVMGRSSGSGEGLAVTGSICDNALKAQGVSKEGGTPFAQVFFDQTLFHEVGHHFGMTHSYNSSIPVCTTRESTASVEPGSGATIMSYGFTCDGDDYFTSITTGPILSFHTINYSQAVAQINSVSCFTSTATGNNLPVITLPANATIPMSTPFELAGSATDADGDALTYSWEGTNIGTMTPDAPMQTQTQTPSNVLLSTMQPPFFRSYGPVATPIRTYPLLSAILNGSNTAKGDKLPSVAIATTHRFTVFDNRAGGGATVFGAVTVTIDGASGPFLVTNDLTGTVAANSTQIITWSVNNTNTGAVNTPNVKISLSTDGGLTFPNVLLASTANNGTASVTLPNLNISQARIKVQAVGNIFFDISNNDFIIAGALPVEMVAFDVKLKGKNDAELSWRTASEKNNAGYDVEMMDINGENTFQKAGFMKGNGTTLSTSDYSFIVPNLPPSTYYFRLKQTDQDGRFNYSAEKVLVVAGNGLLVNVFPNPVINTLNMSFYMEKAGEVSLSLNNQLGQVAVVLPAKYFDPGRQNVAINTANLPSGVYFYHVESFNQQARGKLFIVK